MILTFSPARLGRWYETKLPEDGGGGLLRDLAIRWVAAADERGRADATALYGRGGGSSSHCQTVVPMHPSHFRRQVFQQDRRERGVQQINGVGWQGWAQGAGEAAFGLEIGVSELVEAGHDWLMQSCQFCSLQCHVEI